MNRRGFLQAILAAGVAPAFVGSSILMPVQKLWVPPIYKYWAVEMGPDFDPQNIDHQQFAIERAKDQVRIAAKYQDGVLNPRLREVEPPQLVRLVDSLGYGMMGVYEVIR